MTGFFEESPGVRSMTRLVLFITIIAALLVVIATCGYLVFVKEPKSSAIVAMTGMLAALVANGVVAIIKRNGGADAT